MLFVDQAGLISTPDSEPDPQEQEWRIGGSPRCHWTMGKTQLSLAANMSMQAFQLARQNNPPSPLLT